MWMPTIFIFVFSTIRTKVAIDELRFQIYYLYGTLIFVLPPAITCGLIRIQTGTFGCFVQIALGWINYQY
jgi:hypothetical protein